MVEEGPRHSQGQGPRTRAGCVYEDLSGETRRRCGEGPGPVGAPQVLGEEMSSHAFGSGGLAKDRGKRNQPDPTAPPLPHLPASGGLGHLPYLELLQETKFPCLQMTRGRRGGERGGVTAGAGWSALSSSSWAWSVGPASAGSGTLPPAQHGHGGRE